MLQHIGAISDGNDPTPSSWRHFQLVGEPVGSTAASEKFVTTMDIANITGGAVDSTWNDADYATVWAALDELMTAWAANMPTTYRWVEVRSYVRMFNDYSNPNPFVLSGPPERIIPTVRQGTSGAATQAPQVSITSTDRTPYARHWGRNYWPHPSSASCTPAGYVSPSVQTALATAVHSCYADLQAAEFFPVVPITMVGGIPTRGLLTVNEVQVDDLFDVIRRRRQKLPTSRIRLGV